MVGSQALFLLVKKYYQLYFQLAIHLNILMDFFLSWSLGILDQGSGVLIIYDQGSADSTYTAALDTINHMGQVVDALYEKAKTLP